MALRCGDVSWCSNSSFWLLSPKLTISSSCDDLSYDAEMGRISIYVDNKHVGSSYAPITYTRSERDIGWTQSCVGTDPPDCELDYTRIGNGYDANDKNFRGCTGGFQVYGKALQVTTQVSTLDSFVPLQRSPHGTATHDIFSRCPS